MTDYRANTLSFAPLIPVSPQFWYTADSVITHAPRWTPETYGLLQSIFRRGHVRAKISAIADTPFWIVRDISAVTKRFETKYSVIWDGRMEFLQDVSAARNLPEKKRD